MIRGIPYDAEIEYLQSTGTQWIDTGVVPTAGTIISIGEISHNYTVDKARFNLPTT